MVEQTCNHCGKTYKVSPCRAGKAKFCSTRCHHASRRTRLRVDMTCPTCGKRFESVMLDRGLPKYCNNKCYRGRREWLSSQGVASERGSMTDSVLLYLNKHGDRTMAQLNLHFSETLTPNQVKSAITALRTRGDVDVVGKTDDGIYIFGVPSTRDDRRRPLIEKYWPSTGVMGNTL